MKGSFWLWMVVIWSLMFSVCGVVWSIVNTRELNEMKEKYEIIEKGEYKWQILLG